MSRYELLTVVVDDQQFGIPVTEVHDVLRAQAVTRVPKSRTEVAGVLNLRGRIVTALDLRIRLGRSARGADQQSMHVVVHHQGEPYGLVVDGVGDVVTLGEDVYEPTPANLDPLWSSLCTGVFRLKSSLLLMLDVARLLNDSRAKAA